LLRNKGELLLLDRSAGAALAAEDCFRHALDWARRDGALFYELRAAFSIGRLWRDQGRGAEAHDLATSVYGRFTEGVETADLRTAKRLLDGLALAPFSVVREPSARLYDISLRFTRINPAYDVMRCTRSSRTARIGS
jgi:hypothetical protein